jgi:hypothetical protein
LNSLDRSFDERRCIGSGIVLADSIDALAENLLVLLPNERHQLDLVQKGTDLFSADILEDRSPARCAVNPASIIEAVAK